MKRWDRLLVVASVLLILTGVGMLMVAWEGPTPALEAPTFILVVALVLLVALVVTLCWIGRS